MPPFVQGRSLDGTENPITTPARRDPEPEDELPPVGFLRDDDDTPFSFDPYKEEGNSFGDMFRAAGRQILLNSRQRQQAREKFNSADDPQVRESRMREQEEARTENQTTAASDTSRSQPQANTPTEENLTENRNTFMNQNPPGSQGGSQSRQGQPNQNQQSGGMPPWQRELNQMLANAQESVNQQNRSRSRGEAQGSTRSATTEIPDPVGPRSDFVRDATKDVVLMDPGASQEEMQRVMSEGKIPVPQSDLSNVEKFQEIDVDFSRSKEAVRNFADAKVQAAKKGALASQVGAENANTRLMANALGPGLFQALSGVQQPTNQQSNFNAQAARRVEEAEKAKKQAEQTAELAPARAEQQVAELDRQERGQQRQFDRKTQQLNNAVERQKAKAERSAVNRYVDTTVSLASKNRQYEQGLRQQEIELAQDAIAKSGNPNVVNALKDVNSNLASTIQQEKDLEAAANFLSSDDVSDKRKQEIRQDIASRYGVVDASNFSIGNGEIVTTIREKVEDVERRRAQLEDDRIKIITNAEDKLPEDQVGTNPSSAQSNTNNGPSSNIGNPETPGNEQDDDNSNEPDYNAAEEEYLQRNGVDL